MPKSKGKQLAINYSDREFDSIRNSLIQHAQRYYPDTIKDFNEASFGSFVIDTVSYVGDILSFYLDYQANESYLDTSIEYDNIIKLSKQLGYRYKGAPSSYGMATFFILVPAKGTGQGPDSSYYPILQNGSTFKSASGASFILTEDVDFSKSTNEIIVAEVNTVTGAPTSYAVKATGHVVSGIFDSVDVEVADYERFLRLAIPASSQISEILSVVDSEGNEYFEVDYLSQDVIYRQYNNPNSDESEDSPMIMKPVIVPRRFVVEKSSLQTFLQFGFGSEEDIRSDIIADPSQVVLSMTGKNYTSDTTFDPTKILKTDKLGVVPSNTTLTIRYRRNNVGNINIPVGALTQVGETFFTFKNEYSLDTQKVVDVKRSIEVLNEEPILGQTTFVNTTEIKQRAYGSFNSQSRAVTMQDYKNMIYSMPNKFGSVARCAVMRDPDSFRRNLNIYVISRSNSSVLAKTNTSIKQNLKTWINRHKMVNDTVDILDANIVNLGISFTVLSQPFADKYELLDECFAVLTRMFKVKPEIGEAFVVTDVFKALNNIPGVADTTDVNVFQKTGTNYSTSFLNIESSYSPDRRYIYVPKNFIYEVKYPNVDIEGVVK